MSPCASLSLRVHTHGDNLSVPYISGLCHHSFSPVNGAYIPLAVGRQTLHSTIIQKYNKIYLILLYPAGKKVNFPRLSLRVLKQWLLSQFTLTTLQEKTFISLCPLPHQLFIHPLTHCKAHSSFLCLWITNDLISKSNSSCSFFPSPWCHCVLYPVVGKFCCEITQHFSVLSNWVTPSYFFIKDNTLPLVSQASDFE